MSKPYSDRRWWDVPKAISSQCNECCYDGDFAKCEKYPDGIPKEILKQSFPGMEGYKEDYCSYRTPKESTK